MKFNNKIKNIFIAVAVIVFLFFVSNFIWPLPLSQLSDTSTTIVAEDGTPLRVFSNSKGVWKFKTSVADVSPLYIQALIEYEDKYFYYHPGINPIAMLRASAQNIAAGKIVSGASTLTMQVARLLDPHGRTFSGKFKQIFRALQLEWSYSKQDILGLYLELAPFGGNLQGVEAASRAYFDKAPIELSHAEAALLAVLPQSPSKFRPDRFPLRAARARDKVVQRLVDYKIWSEQILTDIKMETVYAKKPMPPLVAPLLSRRLLNAKEKNIVKTSVDYSLQLALQTRLKDHVASLPKGTTAAAVIVENKSWLVKSYVGTANFSDRNSHGYVDMVRARRSPGSTLKPFIYGIALDESYIHSQSLLVDAPRWKSDYQPENFSGSFNGAVSATTALQKSLNVPAVQILEKITPQLFMSRLQNVGVRPMVPLGQANLSMALGGFGVSMEELLNLYGAIGREGKVAQLRFSEEQNLEERPILTPQAAWIIYKMLSTQKRSDRPFDSSKNTLAFKTGTSYGYRDAWAFGVSGKYTIGIWVGRPDGTPSPGQYGAVTALPLLFQVSDWLGDDSAPKRPQNVSNKEICWPSGLISDQVKLADCHLRKKALGIDGQFPVTLPATENDGWKGSKVTIQIAEDTGLRTAVGCDIESIDKQISLWPVAVEPWLSPEWRREQVIPKMDKRCSSQPTVVNQEFSILSIKNNSHIRNLKPKEAFRLPLTTLGSSGLVIWYFDGEKVKKAVDVDAAEIWLKQGKHELIAIDESGAMDRVGFMVEQW